MELRLKNQVWARGTTHLKYVVGNKISKQKVSCNPNHSEAGLPAIRQAGLSQGFQHQEIVTIRINKIQSTDTPAWDEYVYNHPRATLCHLSGWHNVINRTYGHKTYYLMATKDNPQLETRNAQQKRRSDLSTIPAPPVGEKRTCPPELGRI